MDIDDAASAFLLQLLPMGVSGTSCSSSEESHVLALLSLSMEGSAKTSPGYTIIYYIVAILSSKLLSLFFKTAQRRINWDNFFQIGLSFKNRQTVQLKKNRKFVRTNQMPENTMHNININITINR